MSRAVSPATTIADTPSASHRSQRRPISGTSRSCMSSVARKDTKPTATGTSHTRGARASLDGGSLSISGCFRVARDTAPRESEFQFIGTGSNASTLSFGSTSCCRGINQLRPPKSACAARGKQHGARKFLQVAKLDGTKQPEGGGYSGGPRCVKPGRVAKPTSDDGYSRWGERQKARHGRNPLQSIAIKPRPLIVTGCRGN